MYIYIYIYRYVNPGLALHPYVKKLTLALPLGLALPVLVGLTRFVP